MYKKVIFGCLIALLLTSIGFASVNQKSVKTAGVITATSTMEWNITFGGTDDEYADSLIQTKDGGFAFAGSTTSFGAGGDDFWLVKTDTNGQMEWNRTFGGIADEWALSLIQTADGGFAFAGVTTSYGAGGKDFWLVKTDAKREHEWNSTFGGSANDVFRSAVQTTDGGFALLGGTWSYGAGDQDMWLVKTNATGQPEWNKTFGGTGPERGLSITKTADGGLALLSGAGGKDFWLVKTDANGEHEWNQTYGGSWDDFGNSITQTVDGGFTLAGGFMWLGAYKDVWMVKTDANRQAEWNQTFGGSAGENFLSVVQTTDTGFALAGWTKSYGAGGEDIWLVRTDANGQHEWNKTFGGITDESASSMIQTTDGGFALAGSTSSYGAGGKDAWLIKTSDSEHTTTQSSPSWTSVISILSLTALLIFRKRMKHP